MISSEQLGLYHLVMSIYIFGITLGNFGINFAVTRLVSENLEIGDNASIKKITKISITISCFTGLLASISILLFSNVIVHNFLHNKISKNVIILICTILPFISMSSAISGYFFAVRKVYKSIFIQFFEQIIKIFFTIFLFNMFLSRGIEYACFPLIMGDALSELFSFFCNFLLYKIDSTKYKTSYQMTNNKYFFIKKIFKFSTPVAITSLIGSGLSTIKQLIIPLSFEKGKINCSKALSIYGEINGMAIPIIVFPNLLFSSISALLIPEFVAFRTQNQNQTIKEITKKILVISSIISVIISFSIFIFANKINRLVYNINNVENYIKILSPISILIILDSIVDNILKGLDAQNDVMIINIADLIITILIISTIIPRYGILGYIYSIYFSEIFNLIFSFKKLLSVISK